MLARLFSFVAWALVAATVVFWGLRLFTRAPVAPPNVVVASEPASTRGDLTRLLGVAPVAVVAQAEVPEASARFKLLGIMAPKSGMQAASGHGVALIAVDGKLPRAYTVGSHLDADWVLQAVSLRTADISPANGAAGMRLELPALPSATTGTLPSVVTLPGVAPPAPAVVQPVPQAAPQPAAQPVAQPVFQPVPSGVLPGSLTRSLSTTVQGLRPPPSMAALPPGGSDAAGQPPQPGQVRPGSD
jgi:general secretion pathway protein C